MEISNYRRALVDKYFHHAVHVHGLLELKIQTNECKSNRNFRDSAKMDSIRKTLIINIYTIHNCQKKEIYINTCMDIDITQILKMSKQNDITENLTSQHLATPDIIIISYSSHLSNNIRIIVYVH